jgi:hypothetical protein
VEAATARTAGRAVQLIAIIDFWLKGLQIENDIHTVGLPSDSLWQ